MTSPGGITAWLIEDHTNPLISLAFGFKGGASGDPQGKEGLATFISGMLDEGAGGIPSADFQKRLADHGIEFGFDASLDSLHRLAALPERRPRSRLRSAGPRLDQAALRRRSRWRGCAASSSPPPRRTSAIRRRSRVARSTTSCSPGILYARRGDGTPQSLAAITVDDLQGLRRQQLRAGPPERRGRGRRDAGSAEAAARQGLRTPCPRRARRSQVAEAKVDDKGGLAVIERDIPQTILLFGAPGIKREDPEFFAAYLVNYALGGGGFSARLMNEVRESSAASPMASTPIS